MQKSRFLLTNYHTGDSFFTSVHDNNNGTYTVSYTPAEAGLYFISATVDGLAIKGSPFLIDVMPGETDPSESTLLGTDDGFVGVTGSEVALEFQAMDINRNKRHKGGDTIIAVMSLLIEESEEMLLCVSDYKTNGLYAISCPAATHSGSFLLDVKLMIDSVTVPIKSSPFLVTIYPGNASSGLADQVRTQNTVEFISMARQWATFGVRTHDRFNNPLNIGGDHFVSRIRGNTSFDPSEKRVEVTDQEYVELFCYSFMWITPASIISSHFSFTFLRNGNYVFAYKLSHPSTYKIDISMVNGTGLIGEYYKNETSFRKLLPDYVVASEHISFNIRHMDVSFRYARWVGYISFPLSTTFDLEMTGIEGKCKLLIGETLIFDTDKASITGSFNAYEHLLYEIQIEYSTVRFLSMKCTFTFQPNLTPLACIFIYRISIACCCNYFGHRSKQNKE